MADHDVDFDFAAANSWKTEVEMELRQVDLVLKEVSEACTTISGEENDPIFTGLKGVGRLMSEKWNSLTSAFQQICTKFGELINSRADSVNKVTDSIDNF